MNNTDALEVEVPEGTQVIEIDKNKQVLLFIELSAITFENASRLAAYLSDQGFNNVQIILTEGSGLIQKIDIGESHATE